MYILVTGGAGYVGSIVTEELLKKDYKVVVLDNLQQGHREAVLSEAEFVKADICDIQALNDVFDRYKIDAVMHMAAETTIEYSMSDPKRYFRGNIIYGINLLDTMLRHNVNRLVFSSSAAVYGEPREVPIEEEHLKLPTNSYGESKLIFENILAWYAKAYRMQHVSLRYFNASGASELLGEDHRPETHLIPCILKAALDNKNTISIFGTDYATKDGTCIRDYVHVVDVANAHILALKKLKDLASRAYNLGNGHGYSVLEVVESAKKVTGVHISTEAHERRPGDPAILVASSNRAKSELGWEPQFSKIDDIIASTWNWMREHPNGYEQ